MYLKRGTRARFTLSDDTTVEGTVRFSWSLSSWKITEVDVHHSRGDGVVRAEGFMILPKRQIILVQAGV